MKKIGSQILVAIVCALLGFLLTYQFKLLTDKNKENVIENNSDILLEIENLKKEKKELEETNMSLSEELKKLEEAAAKEGEVEGEIKKLLDNARMQIGLLDVKGPGIILTITPKNSIFSTNSTQNVKSIS
ncbi:MAG: division initiation protein, partial [Clostridium celatum]|nr:division initiation protein [Clostridium celatum]